jgi:hypothetical protein
VELKPDALLISSVNLRSSFTLRPLWILVQNELGRVKRMGEMTRMKYLSEGMKETNHLKNLDIDGGQVSLKMHLKVISCRGSWVDSSGSGWRQK